MKIYLAGSISNGDNDIGFVDWRKKYAETIKKNLESVEFADPNTSTRFEGDALGLTGADSLLIKQSDVVVVNAEAKIGAGTAMEFVITKYFNKPVIVVLPKNSHHRKTNIQFEGKLVADWMQPFIVTFSDFIIEDIEQIGGVLPQLKTINIKTIGIIDEAVAYAEKIIGVAEADLQK